MNVLYLCDRKACDKCSPECQHTQDIDNAKNYQKAELDTYFETPGLPLILRFKVNLKASVQKRLLNELREQLTNSSVVILPEYIECVYSPGKEIQTCQNSTEPAQTVDPT